MTDSVSVCWPALGGACYARNIFARFASNQIDTHRHFFPPAYQTAWLEWEEARKILHFPSQVAWSKSKVVAEIDEAGIRTAVLSIASTPGVWFDLDADRASQMARDYNDYAAEWIREKRSRWPVRDPVDDRHRPNAVGSGNVTRVIPRLGKLKSKGRGRYKATHKRVADSARRIGRQSAHGAE